MAESYLKFEEKLPCAVFLNGEYGIKNIYAGVPVIIGNNGVEEVVQLKLGLRKKQTLKNLSSL